MENVKKDYVQFIRVKSISLLRKLVKAKCLGQLIKIVIDDRDEQKRPLYIFYPSQKVLEIANNSVVDSREIDGDIYKYYDVNRWENYNDYDVIKSRNYFVAEDCIFDDELVFDIRFIRKNKETGRKTFVIFKNHRTVKIKADRDKESQEAYMRGLEAKNYDGQ